MLGTRSIAERGLSDQPSYGRSFRIAVIALAALAGLELLAIGVGLLRHPATPAGFAQIEPSAPLSNESAEWADSSGSFAQTRPSEEPLPSPDLGDQPVLDPVEPAVPPVAETEASAAAEVEEAVSDPASLFAALAEAARSMTFPEPILEALLATGSELRGKGNTQGAIKNFREVESVHGEHPRVLSELAATLSLMRLSDKAEDYWERVAALGAGAGPYLAIAEAQLRGEQPASETTAPEEPDAEGRVLRIGEIKVEAQPPGETGQKVSLSVVIDADPASLPVGEDMSLIVLFYDRLANGEVRPSTADTSYLYPTEPYDWQVDGTETIIVNYLQPAFTDEQKRELGERSYHGYAVELYYRDELQDKVAMPEDVSALRFPIEAVAPIADDPSPRPPTGPENALFPDAALP